VGDERVVALAGARQRFRRERAAVLERDDRLVGVAPCYLKTHSQGEYVFDYGWADAFERAGGSYYPWTGRQPVRPPTQPDSSSADRKAWVTNGLWLSPAPASA
jgi:predicted N-acyltransferase